LFSLGAMIRCLWLGLAVTLCGCKSDQPDSTASSTLPPAAQESLRNDPLDHMKHDPQEDDPRLEHAFKEAGEYADGQLRGLKLGLGAVHTYWRLKKQFLLEHYGIRWKTPAELNPNVAFD
jgi:hypothetical protein